MKSKKICGLNEALILSGLSYADGVYEVREFLAQFLGYGSGYEGDSGDGWGGKDALNKK